MIQGDLVISITGADPALDCMSSGDHRKMMNNFSPAAGGIFVVVSPVYVVALAAGSFWWPV